MNCPLCRGEFTVNRYGDDNLSASEDEDDDDYVEEDAFESEAIPFSVLFAAQQAAGLEAAQAAQTAQAAQAELSGNVPVSFDGIFNHDSSSSGFNSFNPAESRALLAAATSRGIVQRFSYQPERLPTSSEEEESPPDFPLFL